MFNNSGVTKTTGTINDQILFNTQFQVSVGCRLSGTANATLKAGTPLAGVLTTRDTANTYFEVAADTTENGVTTSDATCVLLHDVVLNASGKGNGTALIFGFVNIDRLTAATQALVTTAAKTALNGKVTFLK